MLFVLLIILLMAVCVVSLLVGSVPISFKEILSSFGRDETVSSKIVWAVRLPRIILAIAVGGALSLAGVLLQGIFRNPLVEPYTLGISGGAALGVAASVSLGLHYYSLFAYPLAGFVGAVGIVVLLYILRLRKEIVRMQGVLLTGVMLSFIASSFVMLILALSRSEDIHGIVLWIMGSLGEPETFLIYCAFLVSLTGLVISYYFSRDLNALLLGEEEAQHLGITVARVKKQVLILASILTGVSVSVSGIIGFVGLLVPHLMRLWIGSDHRVLLGTSFISGAVFLILCDLIARTIIAPIELPVGVITGIIGGILFIFALQRKDAVNG